MPTEQNTFNSNSLSPEAQPAKQHHLGAISFINTLPVYTAFEAPANCTLRYELPSKLNADIACGALDLSPVSSAFYLRNKEILTLLPDLSVSSFGAVESVVFISRYAFSSDILQQVRIPVPTSSETSIALLAALLSWENRHNYQPQLTPYPPSQMAQQIAEKGCGLVIGDDALLLAEKSLFSTNYYCYDLATLWTERTGLPFVFAVWVARKPWAQQYSAVYEEVKQRLIQSRNEFFQSADVFEKGLLLAQEASKLSKKRLERYFLHCLEYTLTEEHLKSLALFSRQL